MTFALQPGVARQKMIDRYGTARSQGRCGRLGRMIRSPDRITRSGSWRICRSIAARLCGGTRLQIEADLHHGASDRIAARSFTPAIRTHQLTITRGSKLQSHTMTFDVPFRSWRLLALGFHPAAYSWISQPSSVSGTTKANCWEQQGPRRQSPFPIKIDAQSIASSDAGRGLFENEIDCGTRPAECSLPQYVSVSPHHAQSTSSSIHHRNAYRVTR